MSIRVHVKGPKKSAQRAAARNRVPVKNCTRRSDGIMTCEAPCSAYSKVVRWYGSRETLRRGRGMPPGALLHYSETCSRESLKGARRRKRRR